MKQLLILSGKGGTGKTTIARAFIEMSKTKAFADCDIEAPNLHLTMNLKGKVSSPFYGMKKAFINDNLCDNCGVCKANCKFNAIDLSNKHIVNQFKCEGCSVCEYVCPKDAIKMINHIDGETTIYRDNNTFSTAELKMGSGNSGKLVMKVKENLKANIVEEELVIIDGAPGIGCPVIASLSGVDMVLVVTEPSVSGMSDMIRIISTASKFKVKTAVCINKYDINIVQSAKIEKYLKDREIDLIGKIIHDKNVSKYLNSKLSLLSSENQLSKSLEILYRSTIELLFN